MKMERHLTVATQSYLFHLRYHIVKAYTPLILLGVPSVAENQRSFQAFNLLLTDGD